MKRIKLLLIVLCIVCTLPFGKVHAKTNDTNPLEAWKHEAIITPSVDQLLPAGPIQISFKGLQDGQLSIDSYEVYVDGALVDTLPHKDKDIYKVEYYTTEVNVHTIQVIAISDDAFRLLSNQRSFAVSKKGLGIAKGVQPDDLKLSWYYNWDKEPSLPETSTLDYIPMIWSNYTGSETWLKEMSSTYHTVLGFNEPDLAVQANLSPKEAIAYQHHFTESGLRIGAPVVTWKPTESAWFLEYLEGIDMDEIDFIPIHVYFDWGDANMANLLFEVIDEAYEKWKKPIWVTEYSLAADWGGYRPGNFENESYTKEYMETTIRGMDERAYVERYAWFSFGINDQQGGATALYDEANGSLTNLGKFYKSLGNPKNSSAMTGDTYFTQIGYYKDLETWIEKSQQLKANDDYANYVNTSDFELILQEAISFTLEVEISEQVRIDDMCNRLQLAYKAVKKVDEPSENKPNKPSDDQESQKPNKDHSTSDIQDEINLPAIAKDDNVNAKSVSTADTTQFELYVGLMGCSMLLVGYILYKRKRELL
ncbi:putative glycosyl hydrolase [Breznakia blatticola]|uniref:Putative glycosyl hydrolase n=1 Tax=Breznakia blatticola TaxID=1754012 RepID=A0A4R8A6H5_9FIRM|nr:glycosyl hydrolase [Breznakia blatticola]TDW26025.1 putative glycosyl hydrolase [Breznakia blatticola]